VDHGRHDGPHGGAAQAARCVRVGTRAGGTGGGHVCVCGGGDRGLVANLTQRHSVAFGGSL
jgi:hypothetical protein